MLRKFLIISFAISLFIFTAESEISAQTRVAFKKGEISGKVSGTLKPNEYRKFVLTAYEAQEIRVNVYSKNNRVKVEGEGGLTSNLFDAVDGDNVIRIYNSSKYLTKFSAVFSVNSMVNNVPREISFKKGRSSAKYDSTVAANGERKFLLRAKKGQEIRVKTLSMNDAVMVEGEGGLTENIFDAVDGDNVIRIYNNTNRRADFIATFSITDLKNRIEKTKPTRINFSRGKSSKTINLQMKQNEMKKLFVIGVGKDQFVDIQVMSGAAAKRVGTRVINDGSGENENWIDDVGYLTINTDAKGDIVFEVSKNDKRYLSSKMKITIKSDETNKTTRIKFDKGKSSTTIDLSMGVGTKSRKFVIGAKKGQTINIDIETKDAIERIAMNLDNGVDNQDDWLDGFGYLMVTTGRSGDYIIEVIKLDKKYLEAKMKISIKADK